MHKLRKLLLTGVAATAIGAGVFALPPTRAVKPAARRTDVPAAGSSATLSKQTPPLRTPSKIKSQTTGFTAAAARRVEVAGEAAPGIVVIPRDWKTQYPFSSRFSAPYGKGTVQTMAAASHVIDLAATRFTTDSLVTRDAAGTRSFADPDLRSFHPQLVRSAFELTDPDFFIVQANDATAQVTLRAYLESQSMSIIDFLPETAYLVRLSRSELARVQARSDVFWVGLYQPAYRIDPKLDYVIEADPAHELKMQALFDAAINPDLAALHGKVAARGLNVSASARRQRDQKVRVSGQAIKARDLALVPGALWVERFVDPELDNDVARTSSNVVTGRGAQSGPMMDVEDVWARGIRGEGQIASAADTGLSTGTLTTLHSDFGQQGSGTNPMRVIKGYALGRTTTWSDPESSGGGHGTHTSGSIVGNGFNSGSSPGTNSFTTGHAGIAPKAQFVFQSVMDSSGGLGGLPTNLNDLFINPYNDGARVHSNSWGSDANGQYTADSQEVDQFIQSHPDMVITFSAGNSGQDGKQTNVIGQCGSAGFPIDGIIDQDSMGAPATAKNCITVGATENYRPTYAYENPVNTCTATNNTWGWFNSCTFSTNTIYSDKLADHGDGLAPFSSRGPTDDGRIKPDVVAPGTGIVSTRTNQSQSTTAAAGWGTCGLPTAEKTYYNSEGGTSMANPLTAGAAVLVRQYYVDGWHANNTSVTNGGPSAGGFAPSAALVKATLINGAWDLSPGQYGTGATKESAPSWDSGRTLPNNAAGFGRVDLEHSLFPGAGWGDDAGRVIEVHDVAAGMTTGASTPYTFTVTGSANPLIITLAWSDPYAASGAGTKLVNNLDLIVTSPTGVRYYSNGLDKTAGADDTLNNVEQVKVTNPATGAWTVQVRGTNVPGNAVAGSNSQTYALVMSGIAGVTVPDTAAPVTSITAPLPGAVITGTTSVTATATDDRGVTRVEFYLDGALQSTDTSEPYAWSWNSVTSANGPHTLQSKAFDAAGNSGSSTVVDVTTSNDTVAPTTSITSPASGATVSGVVAVNADATDNVGVSRVEIYLDGAIKQTCTASPCSWSWNTATSTNGAHNLQSKAFDAAGNAGSSATVSVTVSNVDSQAPTAPGSLVANGGKKRVDLTWNASTDNVGVSSYRVFRATAATGPFTQVGTATTTSFGDGGLPSRVTYYYYVVAVDAAGNVSAASNTASATTR